MKFSTPLLIALAALVGLLLYMRRRPPAAVIVASDPEPEPLAPTLISRPPPQIADTINGRSIAPILRNMLYSPPPAGAGAAVAVLPPPAPLPPEVRAISIGGNSTNFSKGTVRVNPDGTVTPITAYR